MHKISVTLRLRNIPRATHGADSWCEYCHLPQAGSRAPFEIDHIIARKHRGRTVAGNLALSCVYCNAHKGPNLTGRDPETGKITRLYHPRRYKWTYHFRFHGSRLIGRTASAGRRLRCYG